MTVLFLTNDIIESGFTLPPPSCRQPTYTSQSTQDTYTLEHHILRRSAQPNPRTYLIPWFGGSGLPLADGVTTLSLYVHPLTLVKLDQCEVENRATSWNTQGYRREKSSGPSKANLLQGGAAAFDASLNLRAFVRHAVFTVIASRVLTQSTDFSVEVERVSKDGLTNVTLGLPETGVARFSRWKGCGAAAGI